MIPGEKAQDSTVIQVNMGEGIVTREPHIILASGIGSCVVITLYDPRWRIGGLAHIMMPESSTPQKAGHRMQNENELINNKTDAQKPKSEIIFHYADTAIDALLERLQNKGASQRNVQAKMVGGARMFRLYDVQYKSIGEQNIMNVKRILKERCIHLIGWDIGGRHGRNVEFHLNSGRLIVKAIGRLDKEI